MAAIDFQELFNGLKKDAITLAKASFKTFANEAEQDAQHLLENLKDKLSRWTVLLADGKLTAEDFELLVGAQKELLEMKVLQRAGLAAIKIEQFKNSVINLITDTVFHAIPGV